LIKSLPVPPMSDSIPIQNIYYLLCYAWNKLDEGETVEVSSLDSIELADLFALVLASGTRHLLRRGFDRDYLAFSEETPRIRGRINFPETIKRNLMTLRRPLCEFDELSYDVLHNRILKTTINGLLAVDNLDKRIKEELWETSRWLREVSTVRLSSQVFRRVQLHRNNNYYRFLLNVCELVYESLLVDEQTGQTRFRDFLRDEGKMRALFEEFVRNFYRLRQTNFNVRSRKLQWHIETEDSAVLSHMPEMRTDICLESDSRQVILDCKFAKDVFSSYFDKESLKPAHLYQMYAYLNHAREEFEWSHLEGILLYPVVKQKVDLRFRLDGFPFQIRTIDLNQNWQDIEERLLEIIQ
jgi:5-methylcytosine-specific restriction enzyme subunit McrC